VNVAVVIPVRNGMALVEDCLSGVVAQAAVADAEVVVVDDASTDQTADVARRAGARVIVLDAPSGPYVARNVGWQSVEADVIVFTDVRCRPDPGWLAALVAPLAEADVAVVGGDVVTLSGPTVAMQWAAEQQSMRLAVHYEDAYYLPATTTASMAIRRTVLEAVGGFAAIRSGGDIDMSWRVQEQGLGRLAPAYDATMTMLPRESSREVIRQWHRFAYGHLELHLRHPQRGEVPAPASRKAQLGAIARGAAMVTFRPRGSRRVRALEVTRLAIYHRAYTRVWQDWQRRGAPTDQLSSTAAT
jgi:cellulose synthase/poly-beta-1,6-N-acetylglucosamine synthase-like glycosyltransferase